MSATVLTYLDAIRRILDWNGPKQAALTLVAAVGAVCEVEEWEGNCVYAGRVDWPGCRKGNAVALLVHNDGQWELDRYNDQEDDHGPYPCETVRGEASELSSGDACEALQRMLMDAGHPEFCGEPSSGH